MHLKDNFVPGSSCATALIWKETVKMKLIDFAKRRADGLIDHVWVEGFEAYKLQMLPEACPYDDASASFNTWIEGWREAAYSKGLTSQDMQNPQLSRHEGIGITGLEREGFLELSSGHSPEAEGELDSEEMRWDSGVKAAGEDER